MSASQQSLIESAQALIHRHPKKLVQSFFFQNQLYWIKRRPLSKKTVWHRLQNLSARLFALPIFFSTVCQNSRDSFTFEAERLALFTQHNIPVAQVELVNESFLITKNAGLMLEAHLNTLKDKADIHQCLQLAIKALRQLHQAGLCHGKPSPKDMTILDGRIHFIDLEEAPEQTMSLNEAQARDVWLFFHSIALYGETDPSLLVELFDVYRTGIENKTLTALKKMVNTLKPIRILLNPLKTKLGKDARKAIIANHILEMALNR